jgi:hypothetical protein
MTQPRTQPRICLVSGHYPTGVFFAGLTRDILRTYAQTHGYDFYYDPETAVPRVVSELHFRRCLLLRKAHAAFPAADWYLWLDTDIYVQAMDRRIEEFIDLSDPAIRYHLFHERPWHYPINTGVKFVHRDVIAWEDEIHARRHGCEFPFEQKVVADYILPTYGSQVRIHDPDRLNCLYGTHRHEDALFVHVCNKDEGQRNRIILSNTRALLRHHPVLRHHPPYRFYHWYLTRLYAIKLYHAVRKRIARVPALFTSTAQARPA